jgi:hypothetical protein
MDQHRQVTWQQVIVVNVGGVECQLTHAETADLIRWLQTPNPTFPDPDTGSMEAAVFLQRLVEDPDAENPPMTNEATRGILRALIRMHIQEGLTPRQQALHDALLVYLAHG